MTQPTKSLPEGYTPAGSVTLKNTKDVAIMLFWSIILLIAAIWTVLLVLRSSGNALNFSFTLDSPGKLIFILSGILLATVVMLIVHEGLHGLVFWVITREMPRFTFKWYYASASAVGWYLPTPPYLVATLLPLVGITLAGLLLVPASTGFFRFLLILLIVFNASGCAGDLVVALRLLKLPKGSLSLDRGDSVEFYRPPSTGD